MISKNVPLVVFLKLMCVIIASDSMITLLLFFTSSLGQGGLIGLIDSTLLGFFLIPILYFLVVRPLRMEIKQREKTELNLRLALIDIELLQGILPIYCHCRKVRHDDGYWLEVEDYLHKHPGVKLSHGICPDCMTEHYPGIN